MGQQIRVDAERTIPAPAEQVYQLLADYREGRPRVLPANYQDWTVEQGGRGAGTVVSYRFRATRRRVRPMTVEVSEPAPGRTLVERDRRSSLVNTWTLTPVAGGTAVRVATQWQGGGGIGGFFERTFAPLGLRRIHQELLERLAGAVGAAPRP
jgi:uncharacterized protein YndB with AHSA1/START domain